MADRYWVGGTASWDGTAGTKWAATSGGAGGATVPTTADDVFFDGSSTGTITIATGNTGAKSINCTGFADTITGSANITVAGSVTLVAAMTYTHAGTVTFTGTGTLTTAGKTFGNVNVNGGGITLTLGDALNMPTRSITIIAGTFDTGNYSISCGAFSSSNSITRTINLGSSTITLMSGGAVWSLSTTTNLTFNAGTSLINVTGAVSQLLGSLTFHDVTFSSTSPGSRNIVNACTFNNLTLNTSATGFSALVVNADQTINGTFTCAGSSFAQRGFVCSNVPGSARTITAAVILADDCDFQDITIAGAASPISPTRAGDGGGNTNITFPAAKTVYRVGADTTWQGSSSWALTSGGTGSNDNFPLAQDTVVINDDTTLTGTLVAGGFNVGTLDCSNRTNAITLNFSAASNRYGSHTFSSAITLTGTAGQAFMGSGTMYFTSAGRTVSFPLTVDTSSGTVILGDAFNSTQAITLTRGTFNANNYNVTCLSASITGLGQRTLTMGSGLWTLSGVGIVWSAATTINLTFNKDTANILLSNNSTTARSFTGGSLSYNTVTIGGSSATSITTFTVISTTSFAELASTKAVAHTIRFSANFGTIGTWSITGTSGNVVTVNSSVAGARRTFTLTNVTSGIDHLSVQDIGVTDANRFYVGANSIDNGNNNNVIFTAAPTAEATGNMIMLFH